MANNPSILLLSTQKQEVFAEFGIQNDFRWFADALQIAPDRLRCIHVPTQGLPETVEESGIIIGGSAHSTYETDQPWISSLEDFVRNIAQTRKAILGVCFGHQIIAQALGGKVEKNPMGTEFGSTEIQLSEAGMIDPLFDGLQQRFIAEQSHSDIVTVVPPGAVMLAYNAMSAHQSLAIGDRIRTVQFHPEIDASILRVIAEVRKDRFIASGFIMDDNEHKVLMESFKDAPEARRMMQNFLRRFLQ